MTFPFRWIFLTFGVVCLPSLTWAERSMMDVVFGDLAVSVLAEAQDVYRVNVTPNLQASAPADAEANCRSRDGTTEARFRDGWLEVRQPENTNSPALWRGRITSLPSYGRASVPGSRLEWEAATGEAIYGLGQRFNRLDQAGQFAEMWIRDAPGQGDRKEASYFCTPVLFSPPVLSPQGDAPARSIGYALFAGDNPDGEFSLNPLGEGFNRYLRAGQSWSFYLAFAPTLKELIRQRAAVQGPFRGVPDWAWGPWISRNSYENQGEAEEAIQGMVQRNFPVSVIVQEAWKGSSDAGDFNNFSSERWPRLNAFLSTCGELGIRNILWQVPIVHPSTPDFAGAERNGFFVRAPDGSVSWRREWLAGFANVDFTHPRAVAWWQDQMRDELQRGVRGFKADDGEDIKGDDVFSDGRRGWQLHNEYSILYAKALYGLFDEEGVDAMLWSRSASLGVEDVPALWAGDQGASWASLRSLLPAGLSASISGAPFWSHDIGGYFGETTPELYIRWLQFGAFSPLMQYHGVEPREPWRFGRKAEAAYRFLSHLRMNLKPTLIALGREAAETGMPMMRPMALEFPDDPRFVSEDSQYMLGANMLVAPVLDEGALGRRIKFPDGRWQHLTMPYAYDGPSEVYVPIDPVSAPVFVRESASLSVELAPDADLGTWSNGAPERVLSFGTERPILENIRFPASGSTLSGRAAVQFDVRSDYTGVLHAATYPPGRPQRRKSLAVSRRDGRAYIELKHTGTRETDAGVVIHNGSETLFAGTVRWQSPVTLEAEAAGSRFVQHGRRIVRIRLVNRSDETLPVVVEARPGEGATIDASSREVQLKPHGEWSGECTVDIDSADDLAGVVTHVVASSRGRILGGAKVAFARPLRMAVAGPFPGREKELFHSPFPPEWNTSPDVQFHTAEESVRWVTLPADHQAVHDGVDFEALWGDRDHAAGYAMARVHARTALDAELRLGTDDTVTVWLNGRQVFAKEVYRLAAWDQEVLPVRLQAGDNTLVVKVAQDRNPWRLLLRITGPHGTALEGVTDTFDAGAFAADRPEEGPTLGSPEPIRWLIAGPFPIAERSAGLPGQLDHLAASREPWAVEGHSWRRAGEIPGYSGLINFNDVLGTHHNADAYAAAALTVSRPTPVELRCGSDDGLVVWLNGRRIHAAEEWRGFKQGEDVVHLTLPPGQNRLYCRIRQGDGEWKFQVEAWDVSALPYRPLETKP